MVKSDLYVVKFSASWCGPCKQMEPYWQTRRVQQELKNYKKFTTVDIDRYKKWSEEFCKVNSIPTILIIDNNYNVYKRHVGYTSDIMSVLKNPFSRSDHQPI